MKRAPAPQTNEQQAPSHSPAAAMIQRFFGISDQPQTCLAATQQASLLS
jgi:hypothetical protein